MRELLRRLDAVYTAHLTTYIGGALCTTIAAIVITLRRRAGARR